MICASSIPASETYVQAVPHAIRWLITMMQDRDWREVLPQLAAYPTPHFDYAADDRALAADGERATEWPEAPSNSRATTPDT